MFYSGVQAAAVTTAVRVIKRRNVLEVGVSVTCCCISSLLYLCRNLCDFKTLAMPLVCWFSYQEKFIFDGVLQIILTNMNEKQFLQKLFLNVLL